MGKRTGDSNYSYCGVVALVFLSLSSSAAISQNRPTPPSSQTWADPGAIERAKKGAATPDLGGVSGPTTASPTLSNAPTAKSSVPPVQKTATGVQSSSMSKGEMSNKAVNGPETHKRIRLIQHRHSGTHYAGSSGPTLTSISGHKFPGAQEHVDKTPEFQPHNMSKAMSAPRRTKVQHIAHEGHPDKKDLTRPAAATGEFDPIYGYSNSISVAY